MGRRRPLHDSQTKLFRTEEEEIEAAHKKRVKDFAKKSTKYIATQIGLVVMVSLYAVAGGFIFQHLESTNEMAVCVQGQTQYDELENSTVYKMWAIASSFRSKDDQPYAAIEFHKQLQSFRDNILAIGWDGTNCTTKNLPNGPGYKWSFMGSLLFSTTVFTTVGYGNIAPETFWGRLVCIAYAVLGIPLMLLCLANIGEIMANIFRLVYLNIACCACNCFRRRVVKARPKSAGSGGGTSDTEAWKNQFNNQRDQNSAAAAPSSGQVIDDDDDDEDDDEEDDNQTLSVPLTVTILMLAFYIFMGALLFGVWESWDWLVASYFCFITISTIGFGDYVPGYSNNNEDTAEQLKMVGAAVYIVLGMALMSMAFNLIQEEMVVKFKWLGSKMGLVKKEDDDDDDEGEAEEPDQHQHQQPQQQGPAAMMGGYPHPTSSMPPRQVGPGGPGPVGAKNAMAPSAGPMAAQKPKPFYQQEHDKNK